MEQKLINYFSSTRLTKRQIGVFFTEEFVSEEAIINNICTRCGAQIIESGCDNCAEFGKLEIGDRLYFLDAEQRYKQYKSESLNLPLTKLQKEASTFMINNHETKKDSLIWAVCGAGKTELTFPLINNILKKGKSICFAIPRVDILYDIHERLCFYFPEIDVIILNGNEKKNNPGQIYVMTTNQVLKFKEAFEVIFIDEVDAFPYEYNPKFDYAVKRSITKTGSICYLTSTPSEEMKKKEVSTFIIYRRWHDYDLPVPKFRPLSLKSIERSSLPLQLKIQLRTRKRQQLWFVANIKFGEKVLQAVAGSDINIEFVYSQDSKRRSKIEKFKSKEIDILITTTILERGVTFDDIDVLVLDATNAMYNLASLVQIAGRVGRKKDYQLGKVFFYHQGINEVMYEAKMQIIKMNGMF
ncbi:MAG: DEAD/DEAH box helicase family protein [Spiroplasma sp.]|nr:DEAD/DEAH box helicase family protein [Mycoplasmatales bacterium]